MNSSTGTEADDRPRIVLVREAGVPYAASLDTDPVVAWMSLMEVVEALCPRWPAREPSKAWERFLL